VTSLNAKYLVALKTFAIGTSLHTSRGKCLPKLVSVCEAYREATHNPYGCMIVDFAHDTDDLLRYRTNVFPSEYPTITIG